MRLVKKIITLICIIAISLSCLVVPASAVDVGGMGDLVSGVADFGQWAIDSSLYGIKLVARIFDEDVCPERPGGVNTTHSFVVNTTTKDGVLADWYVCEYCGFNSGYKADSESLSAAYDDYVTTLPASGYNSDGSLIWSVSVNDVLKAKFGNMAHFIDVSELPYTSSGGSLVIFKVNSSNSYFGAINSNSTQPTMYSNFYFEISFPLTGRYKQLSSPSFSIKYCGSDGAFLTASDVYPFTTSWKFYSVGDTDTVGIIYRFDGSFRHSYIEMVGILPTYEVIPETASADTYNINTRPTSIIGGNYGIVGDNGQITKVEDNSTIINETNNTYYNPATGQTVPITGWTYDYSDRSYKVTMEGGKTSTVTYGDENISITETTVNESGDTITNNYTIYYLIDGAGSETTPCEHTWSETSTTPATCTLSGSKLLTCSKCQQTKTETIPALGHDWQVKQTVTTQYDEEGNLTQQGYTIFECSRCHEQYKSPDGTIPPGGGSGTDPGGEEGETIWDKLGNLIGAIGGGVIGLIDAALGKVLDALIVLAEKMMEKLKVVVETVLSIFDELPLLFGGFLDFLAAVFPFLPPEIMTILTFGVIAVVFIAIIKAVRR